VNARLLAEAKERNAVERAIREREELLRITFDAAPAGISMVDLQRRFIKTNAAYRRLVGYTEEELRGMPTFVVNHPDDAPRNSTVRQELLDGERSAYVIEKRYRTKSGDLVWVRNSVSLVRERDGKAAFTVAVCEDITERKRAQRELERQVALNRLLAELAAAANRADTPEQALEACLELICEYGGWHLGNVLQIERDGDPWRPMGTQHHFADARSREQLAAFVERTQQTRRFGGNGLFILRAIKERAPQWIARFSPSGYGPRLTLAREAGVQSAFVFPVIVRDEVVACVEFFALEVREPDPALMAAAGDIASHLARVIERESATQFKAQLAAIVDASADAIVSRAPDGKVVSWNRAAERMFGYSATEVIGTEVRITPDDYMAETLRHRAFVNEGATLSQFETVRVTRDGRRVDVAVSASPTRDAGGKVTSVATIFRDITERKAAEKERGVYTEQLRALSRRLAELQETERRNLSRELHDRVGQYLTALAINLTLIRKQLSADSAERVANRIDDSTRLVEATVDAVHDLMGGLRPPMLDDCGLLVALHWHAGEFMKRTGIAVSVAAAGSMPRLSPASELTLYRVAQEALTNVAKHAQARQVLVALDIGAESARLDVIDDGHGFDPVTSVHSGERPHWGLISMRERAQAGGGTVRVHSGVGRGTHVVAEVRREA
jgi:PAS domain S-box-containing protein